MNCESCTVEVQWSSRIKKYGPRNEHNSFPSTANIDLPSLVWDKIFRSLCLSLLYKNSLQSPLPYPLSDSVQYLHWIETVTDGQCIEVELLQHFLFWTATNNTAAWLHYGCFSFRWFPDESVKCCRSRPDLSSLSPIMTDDGQHRLNRLYSIVLYF